MSEPVLEPDVPEILQEEPAPDLTAIPVRVEAVESQVRVQVLPDKGGSTLTKSATATRAVRVLVADPRRKSAVLMSMDQNILVAFSEAACQADSSMAVWPKLVPLEVPATVEVWVKSATGTTAVGVLGYRWAEG
ncbi:hypothetical protein ABTY59_37385 [Streptomyces sp. NPDC096079]|uniref:hypothetical protein n=1 Tax=Streptomyces sp. NPDC096079 TaxID=3155820 RepID=UPI00332FAA51